MTDGGTAGARLSRRGFLKGGVVAAGLAATGVAGYKVAPMALKRHLGLAPEPYIPDVPEGKVTLEEVESKARGQMVHLYTAVPAGYGDGAGLPAVIALHGGSTTAADFPGLQLGRFVTAAVRAGAPPFVLAGADGGLSRWSPTASGDDPRAMVLDEMPVWLQSRGFDGSRRALWGWSMGGYGALRMAEIDPTWMRAVAAFSPAIGVGDHIFLDEAKLAGVPLGVWIGTSDPFYAAVREFVAELDSPPQIVSYSEGGHTTYFWNQHTIAAMRFLAAHLGS